MRIIYTNGSWLLNYDKKENTILFQSEVTCKKSEAKEAEGTLKQFIIDSEYEGVMVKATSFTTRYLGWQADLDRHERFRQDLDDEVIALIKDAFIHFREVGSYHENRITTIHWHSYHHNRFTKQTNEKIISAIKDALKGTDTKVFIYDDDVVYCIDTDWDDTNSLDYASIYIETTSTNYINNFAPIIRSR